MIRGLAVSALLVAVAAACGAPSEILDVPYDERHGAATTMDLYLPADPKGPRPAVMFIHGGGWTSGSKKWFEPEAKRLARSGYVTASINYRLGREGRYPNAVNDCLCALAFLRAGADEYGVEPSRVAVVGYSAGGHLAALIGVASDVPSHAPDCDAGTTPPPQAVITGAGRFDLREGPSKSAEAFLGGTPEDLPERYEAASPIEHVGTGEPPFLLIHGGGDWVVDADESRRMHRALIEAGNRADLLLLEGGGHAINPDPATGHFDLDTADTTPEAWIAISDFLERTLLGP